MQAQAAHTVNGCELGFFAKKIAENKNYLHEKNGRRETWPELAERVAYHIVRPYFPHLEEPIRNRIALRQFIPGGRYLYAAGRKSQYINSCFLFRAEDSCEGWGDLASKTVSSLMRGGGIGVVYSNIREEGALISGLGGHCTGPVSLAKIVNEQGRYVKQGGSRRSAVWAGLHWWHPDIFKFITSKQQSELLRYCKKQDYNFPLPLDMTNISVILDTEFFNAYSNPKHKNHSLARTVYQTAVKGMLQDGEPGFSIDIGEREGESLRNACTEVTSSDDGDQCNLASFNLARFDDINDFAKAVEECVALNVCGTLISKLPMPYMYGVREKNRRLGLGLMGLHEWLLRRGKKYGPDKELEEWLKVYARTGEIANKYCDQLGISHPVATRSIAPNGTIGIVAETTTSAEPIPYVAYRRRYLDGNTWKAQYVVDPTALHMVNEYGMNPREIEDSVTLAQDVERRVRMQAWLQNYVDHGISSTINLPPWGSEFNNESKVTSFGNTLYKYLPKLRGVTAYPDGGRDGQPLTWVPYEEAIKQAGVEFTDNGDAIAKTCKSGVCGE